MLVLVILLSNSISHKQFRAPAAAAAKAPPPKVQISFGEDKGLSSVKGSVFTAKAISRYGWATVLMSIMGVFALPEGGLLYGIMLLPFNGRLLQLINELKKSPDDLSRAKSLFRWSILYMFGICLLLLISRTQLSVEFEQQSMQIFFSIVSLLSN